MYQVEQDYCYTDDEIETVHIYVYPENSAQKKLRPVQGTRSRIVNLLVQIFAIILLACFTLLPYTPVYTIKSISVPAHFLPVQHISASVPVVATGSRVIPATMAHGTLTIYNGSMLSESLPAWFIVTSHNGVEVVTDRVVTVPAASLPVLGMAIVPAHAVVGGSAGNIAASAIHQDDGSSLVISNVAAFTGGHDSYSQQFVTDGDTARASSAARAQASARVPVGLQAGPCTESDNTTATLAQVTLVCQFVTYTAPRGVQVVGVLVVGDRVLLRIRMIELPQ